VLSRGSGSLPEMNAHLAETKVLYGLVRMGFGAGAFKRVKHLFVHWTGPKVPIMKRGQWNAVKSDMQELMRPYTMDLSASSLDEIEVQVVVDAIKGVIVSDGDDEAMEAFSVSGFMAALKEEQEKAAAAAAVAEGDAKRKQAEAKAKADAKKAAKAKADTEAAAAAAAAAAPAAVPYIDFEESVQALRSESTGFNWVMCALVK
jgi:NADPH-dependent ferric siderophore reductase